MVRERITMHTENMAYSLRRHVHPLRGQATYV